MPTTSTHGNHVFNIIEPKKSQKKEAGADVVCALACCRCCTLVVAAAVAVENINIARNEQKKPD